MGKVTRFEDLVAWQMAREWTRDIDAVSRVGEFARDFGLRNQIQRASVSVMGNLAEGFERGKRGEFHQFASIAKGSCAEGRSHLYVALDASYLEPRVFDSLLSKGEALARVLGGLRASLERQRDAQ